MLFLCSTKLATNICGRGQLAVSIVFTSPTKNLEEVTVFMNRGSTVDPPMKA